MFKNDKIRKNDKNKKKNPEIEAFNTFKTRNDLIHLRLRLRKARRVWCSGTRETH